MGDEEFRLPGSSYEELTKIIVGYGRFEAEVSPSDVGRVIGMHETIVSRNNAFLVAIAVVAGGKKKSITDMGRALALALEHQMPEEISRHWQMVIGDVPFFRNLLAAVRIRRGMDLPTLQAHVAYSAGQKKSPGVMAGAAAVVEIMRAAGLVQEEGGKLVAAEDRNITVEVPAAEVGLRGVSPSTVVTSSIPTGVAATSGISIQLQIQVQCTPGDLDTLGEKLRTVVRQFSGVQTSTDE